MSADNWRTCPNCAKVAQAAKEKAKTKAEQSYGKVSADEYARLLSESQLPIKLEETLREDYEIGIDDTGEFFMSYGCGCSKCDWKFSAKTSTNALEGPEDAPWTPNA